ncbi:unnamed protein product [Adineta steineri]|uniref:Cyclin N-terminal domain-containing protein n=1 Tax=Adineta steineri TaxID=433720 RepID=A0A813QVF6_9BILA|nr:unnamed protein product [Adineta steineri]CAF0772999.1 unnamed protein product [Adineta steineri]CAF3553992.1 unnamed protein product [Adineta steineri]CAF3768475.1 unnamed protein product [Adineta steineri]
MGDDRNQLVPGSTGDSPFNNNNLTAIQRPLQSTIFCYNFLCDTLEPISSTSADYHTHASRIQRVGLHQYLFEHTNTLLLLEARQSHTLNFSVLWLRTVLQRSAVSLIWRQSIVNWLIGIQRKNHMKEEVAQHCVRLLDARDTLRGHYDRDYQLRAMGYFILVAKFHNRIQVKLEEYSRYSANAFDPRDIGHIVRHLFAELNFDFQLALPQEFVELFLELNSTESCKLNEPKIRALSNLFIHVACIQSWSSCFNASLLATSVLVLSFKFMRQVRPDIPHLNYILWTCTYPVELVLGLAGYIAMIVADMPSEPTDRANHYFYATKLYNDECHHENHFSVNNVKKFCREFVQGSMVNRQIALGMRSLVSQQRRIIEQSYFTPHPLVTVTQQTTPLLNPTPINSSRLISDTPRKPPHIDQEEQKQPMRLTVRAVLAAKRFGKQVMERRQTRQRQDMITVA